MNLEITKTHLCIRGVKFWHSLPVAIAGAKPNVKRYSFAGMLMCEMGLSV